MWWGLGRVRVVDSDDQFGQIAKMVVPSGFPWNLDLDSE